MKKTLLTTLALFFTFNITNSNAIVIPTNFNYKFIGWDETGQRPNYLYGTDVILNGSSLTGTYDQGSITHSLTIKSGATVLSTIQSESADMWGEIYVNGTENNKGELTLDGGTVLVETLTGLTIIPNQYADINIKSGTLIGRTPKFVPSSYLEQYQDEEDDDWVSDAIFHSGYGDINISGGTIDLENSCILKESAYDSDEHITGDINISGGTFNLKEADIYSMNALNITGGTFSLDNTDLSSGDDEFEGTENNNMLIKNATITAVDSDIESTHDITIDGANISLSSTNVDEESYGMWADNNLTIKNNATINVIASYLMAGNNVEVTGGTINFQGGGTILGTNFTCDDHNWCKAGTLNMSGGKLVVQNGSAKENGDKYSNYVQAQTINMTGGILEIKNGAYLETISLVKNDASEKKSGYIDLSKDATIDLSGTLYATVAAGNNGTGTVNVKSSNAVINGDFNGANLNIFANTTLSQLITGNIEEFGALNIKSGKFILNKLPEDEDSGVKSFTLENGATFEGVALVSNGEVNIKGGTFSAGKGLFVSNESEAYSDDTDNINITGGNVTVSNEIYKEITGEQSQDWGGEITLTGNANMNISGASTVINMNFTDSIEDNNHDGGILHEGKNGNINISGGTINLTGKVAKIERGGYDGDWIYTKDGQTLIDEDEFYEKTGMWLDNPNVTDEMLQAATGRNDITLNDIDRDQYHISEGNINISGGTINLKEGARISTTHKNTGDINITGGKISGTLTDKNTLFNNNGGWLPSGRIQHLGTGDLNIKGNAVINMVSGEIQKGNHKDNSDRIQGNVNISENARITLSYDSHINSDQKVNISGGTINLSNDATIDAYGDMNITGGNITIGLADSEPVDVDSDEDVWSAVSSDYKDGNVYISGGNITLYNNAAIGRSAHIDNDMEVEQFGNEITGNMEISGGTINANGNSIILLGWASGDDEAGEALEEAIANGTIVEKGDIIISNNANVTLNDDAEIMHMAQGGIKVTGGEINLNDNAVISSTDSINITGGTINVKNGASKLAGNNINFDGTMNIASGATLNVWDDNTFSHKGTLKTDGTNDDAEGINLSGKLNANIQGDGGLHFKTSSARVNGNVSRSSVLFTANHTLRNAINGTINSLKSLNIDNNATLTYDYTGVINPISEVNVTSGSTLKVGNNLNHASFYNSDMQIAGTIDGSVWGDTNYSTLAINGANATITGDALYFKEMAFNGVNMTLEDQSFQAGDILIDNATLNMNGKVSLEASEDISLNNSIINVQNSENIIDADNEMALTNSDIYIKKNGELTLSARDSSSFNVNNSKIHLSERNQLHGNFSNAAAIEINAGPSSGEDKNVPEGATGNISDFIDHATNLGDINISGHSNLILDKGGIFTFSEDNEEYRRKYEAGTYNGKVYMVDELDFEGEEDEDADYRIYENQIVGTLNIDGQSTVTAKSNFAADEIMVNNGSTLDVTDQILGARTLTVDNGSTVNLTGKSRYVESGFNESVLVDNGSTLTINMIQIGDDSTDSATLTVTGGSTLNVSNGESHAGIINFENSTLNVSKARFKGDAENAQLNFNNVKISADNSMTHVDGNLSIANSNDIKLSNKTGLFGDNTTITNSAITVDNSQVGAFVHAIKIDAEDKDISNRMSYHYGLRPLTELNVTDSDIILNGTSNLGAYMAITEWTTTPGLGSIVGYVTKEIATDASILLSKYKGYELIEDQFGNDHSVIGAHNYQTVVNIDNSAITLNDTSAIINAMLNTEDDSGDINFNESTIKVNGTNIISAAGDINFVNTELVVNSKATLNVHSLTGLSAEELAEAIAEGESTKDLYLTNSNISLAGVINGNIIVDDWREDDNSTLTLKGGRVIGNVTGLNALDMSKQIGNTSKTLAGTTFTDLENVTISGANAKVILDSSVFKVSEGNERRYAHDTAEKEYKDEEHWDIPGTAIWTPYNNQILGDLNVENGATLTLTKHLAANNININEATLVSNNALLAGNLNVSNNATATINGTMLGGLYLDNVNVGDHSTLNLNSVEYMYVDNLTVDNAFLNTTKWTEMMVDELNLIDSKTNIAASGAWIGANTMIMDGGTLDVAGAEFKLVDAEITDAKATISKNTTLGLKSAELNNSTLTLLDTSKITASDGTGNIIFNNDSALVIKGKNNIETYGHLEINDSTLDIASGAVLTTQTTDNVINVSNLRLKLAGTLNATISGTIDTLILGTKASYQEGAFDGLAINSFGISGVSSVKDVARLIGGVDHMTTFEVTDKSNFTWDDTVATNFDNLNVENSTLTIKGDKGMWGGKITATGSTIKFLAGTPSTLIVADEIDLENTALTITGKSFEDLISTINGLNIDNSGNTKAAVAISKVALSTDVNIANVAKATLTNVLSYENLNISGTVTVGTKGNVYNTVATLNNVQGEEIGNLTIDDAKATVQKGSNFINVAVNNRGVVDLKDNISTDLELNDTATATLASKKILTGDVTLNDNSLFTLQGIVNGDVNGGNGTLAFANATAKVNGDVDGVSLKFNKVKSKMNSFFGGGVDNIAATTLDNATLTANSYDDFGNLNMTKSTLELTKNIEADSLNADGSTIKLGTNTLHVSGDAMIGNKSTININVDKDKNYGKIEVAGTLSLDWDAKGIPTTNLAVTLDKSLTNNKFHTGEIFDFLNYGEVNGALNKVTIANNRVTFKEIEVGQFRVTEVVSGKGVIERLPYVNPNLMSVADAIVDSTTEFSSVKQNNLADGLNALSQVVGGEQTYARALEATNPDDNNIVTENTVSTIETVLSAVAERTSSSGISAATEGMASGDTPNGASVWTKVLYNKGKLDSTSSYAGFKSKSNGLALGVDKFINKDVKLGLGYAYTDGDIKNDIRKSDIKTHTAMLYGEYKPSDWFVNGSLSYGWSDYNTKAFSVLGTTKSDFDVYAAAVQMNTGYDINIANKTTLTPVVGLRYINVAQDSYKDSDDKYITKSHSDIVTALASAKLKKSFELNNNTIITPEARLGVSYDIVNDGTNSVVRLSNGSSYMVEGRALNRFGFEAGAGVTAELNDEWELSAGYEGRFRKDYHDHTGMLNLKYNF